MRRILERINRWLGPAAVASSVEPSGGAMGGPTVNPVGVVAVTNEIEEGAPAIEEPADEER
jgi:hypothetical protein